MSKQTEISFYSGLDTIGGVVMELKYDKARIIMEIGSAYNPGFDIFDGNVNLRNSYVSDALWINDAPLIDGIYAKKDLKNIQLLPFEESKLETAVFVSHLHLDHMRALGMLSKDATVYMAKPAQILEQALEDVDMGILPKRENYYKNLEEETMVGEIKVRAFCLNDESYQDYSFYVETPDLKLHYTGDIFIYGKYGPAVKKEAEYVRSQNVDILVCEGTSFENNWLKKTVKDVSNIPHSFDLLENTISEEQCDKLAIETILSHTGLILFNVYEREMFHIESLRRYAATSNRILVYEPKTAYLINRFFNTEEYVVIPDTMDENDSSDWMNKVREDNIILSKKEILAHPEKYMVQNSYPNILELFDYRNSNALYLHHSGTPLGSYDPAWNKMFYVLNTANIKYQSLFVYDEGEFYSHALAYQDLAYIDKVNPKLLIPSHCPNRKIEAENSHYPYYLCELYKRYVYNREKNTLEEIE